VKILVIPDKFKGTLTARAAAEAITRGWAKVRSRDVIESLPMSDGGDGFGEVVGRLLGAKIQNVETVDAAHRRCTAHWWWESKTKTAVIESASVIGLAKLPPGKFHPFELDTFGLGAVIRTVANKGAKRCLIGIGGSATNDGGFGMARALGWKFWDRDDAPLERWTELHRLARISTPKRKRWFAELIVAVDVQNPLLGVRGATLVYGPQKGLRSSELREAERNLRTLAVVASQNRFGVPPLGGPDRPKLELQTVAGAGAAGGLGFGLMTFLGGRTEPGFDLFARFAKLERRMHAVDLVITGEGCVDKSTFMGKGVGEIARWCGRFKVPCVVLAGRVLKLDRRNRAIVRTSALTGLTTENAAKANPTIWLERLAEHTAKDWTTS
jgi:glycerate kinase